MLLKQAPAADFSCNRQQTSSVPHCSPVLVPVSPAASPAVKHVASLQDLCFRVLVRQISVCNVIELMQLVQQFNLPTSSDVYQRCITYVTNSYETLHERRTPEELAVLEGMEPQLVQTLEAARQERVAVVQSLKACLGQVVDRPAPVEGQCKLEVPSVTGSDHSYTYASLVAGCSWPEDVDPKRREEYLSPAEFAHVFGMPYEQYCALSQWRRNDLKKKTQLW